MRRLLTLIALYGGGRRTIVSYTGDFYRHAVITDRKTGGLCVARSGVVLFGVDLVTQRDWAETWLTTPTGHVLTLFCIFCLFF